MKKLLLEELQVESFVTSDESGGRGSVQAYEFTLGEEEVGVEPVGVGSEAYATCKQTCPYTCVYTQDARQCPPLMA